ncbi:MAG: HAD family hydrolase, partial [Vicinamibacterales bacterium]
EDLEWFPYTVDAIRLLRRAGCLVCVVTNQGGVGLGLYDEQAVETVHRSMAEALTASGAHVDGWFYCPHHPRSTTDHLRGPCDCRKPGAGMIREAAGRLGIDVARSFVIGDKLSDVELAVNAGAAGVLVATGYGEQVVRTHGGRVPGAAHIASDLMEATSWILGQMDQRRDRVTP